MADFDFSPFFEDERGAAARDLGGDAEPDGAKPTCPAADAEAAEIAAARVYGRAPDTVWRYATAEGGTAFHVCRWNKPDGEKDIRPLSWFPGEGWRFGAWASNRPLYNLNEIAANPDAPIVVTEGEKAADAAARIFPKSIATTSSGGAQAPSKTDWTPLADRRVLMSPDNDEAGAKYARQVAAILAELGCEVCVIDVGALVAIDPGGRGTDWSADGWDAADALADWPDLEALRKAAASLATPFDAGPAYLSHGPYTMDASGLAIEKTCSKGVTKQTEIHWIAAPFEVLGACRDPQGSAWGKMLRWRDPDGRAHIQHVANADLHGEPAALCAGLEHHGLHIERARQRDFVSYLSSVPVKRRATVVSRTGWHEIGRRSVFVLPGETIGPRGGERVILDAAAHGPYEARGTIEDWRDAPAKLASGHVLPVLAISAALAGPLLHLAGIEGGGVHFFGPSSKGKTTLLHLAGSVWGRGGTPGYVHAWRATANGLEGAAVGATDAALILDELGQVEAREFAAAVYSLANGAGKSRAGRDGGLREPKSWRVIFLSSGEIPIDTKLAEDRGRRARAGQLIRLLDIPVSRAFGAFDLAGSDGDAAALAKACKLAAVSAYGTAGPDFVRRLISEGVTGDGVRALVNDFVRAKVPARADGQIDRAAQRLGLIATAGEMATALGVTDWRPGEAREAAAWALAKWIEGRGGTGPAEVRQAIEQVRHFIDVHGDTRFDNLDDLGARPVPNRAGWRKGAGEDRRWMFASEVWKLDVCAGLDAKFVASVLADRSMLEKGGDGNLKVARIAGRSQRVYVVTPQILDGAGQ